MNLKESFENHPVVFGLSLLVGGFVAGFAAFQTMSNISTPAGTQGAGQESWKEIAQRAGWGPKSECGAYPVSITLSSPGNGSVLDVSGPTVYGNIVIQASRPLPKGSSVGLVVNQTGQPNYHVFFPRLEPNENRTLFRREGQMYLPFEPDNTGSLRFWVALADEEKKFGSVYSSIDQIQKVSPDATISSEVSVSLKPKKF